jgi:hypothetical protein
MIGLVEQGVLSYMPEHLRAPAARLLDLGYEIHYRNVPPRPKKSRYSPREFIQGENTHFTRARMTLIYPPSGEPAVVLQGSVRDPLGDQVALFRIESLDAFWTFAEENGQCPCGDQMYSATSARVVSARRSQRYAHEVRACPAGWATVFHVT